ncbi:MAG: bifunctional hydroxymethylpyrimidine kinase/phosphomethylpyrimidine kinase [Limisphaerales bacterium]
MRRGKTIPCAVTIAGSDSGGGAGIQADLKTFARLGAHGASVITCITAQNPKRVLGIEACSPIMVRRQLEAVFECLKPAAAKTGMLYSAELIRTVAAFVRRNPVPLVVDPVMISTSGARLLREAAVRAIARDLFPLATLLTPNLHEAEILTSQRLKSVEDIRRAAKFLCGRFGCAVLVKGGHLRGLREAVDILNDGKDELLLSAPYVRGVRTHGTGCTYSAAIAACLARGLGLPEAVVRAKEFITQAIAQSRVVAGHPVLNSFWEPVGAPSCTGV